MSHFFLTTVPHDPDLYEVVADFAYSRRAPVHLRNSNDIAVFLDGFFTNLSSLRHDLQDDDLSPEEIIAALYISDQGFSDIKGHFSAVIVDKRRRTLLGITDLQCVGELYYYVGQSGHIALASQFTQLLPYSAKRLDEYALSCYFCLGDVERQDTLVQDIRRITQFYTLHFDGRLKINHEYLTALSSIEVCPSRRHLDVLDHLEQLLISYIKTLTTENRFVCNTLSGGVDSSYLQALLLKQQQVHSFSISFDKYGQDNVYATDIAEYLRTSHEAITFTADEFLQYIEHGIKLTGKPYMYQGEAMFLKLYEHIAARFPNATIVSGQTADGALDSAPPRPVQIALRFAKLPQELLDVILSYFTDEWRGLAAGLQTANISADSMRRIERRTGICRKVAEYLGFAHDVYGHIAEMANGFVGNKEDKLARSHLYSGEMRRIPGMLHAIAEGVGLKLAFPFLDPTFLEYTLTVPVSLKSRKYLGKKLAERYIKHRFVHRPKIDKSIPYGTLFTEEGQWVEMLNVIRRAGYYAFDVDDMLATREYGLILRLINFHLWKRHVLGGNRSCQNSP